MANLITTGNYSGTRGGLDLGCTDEGWFIEIIHKGEMVRFEDFGQNVLDEIPLGADVFVETVLKEWQAPGLMAALWPYGVTFGMFGSCPSGGLIPKEPLILTANTCGLANSNGSQIFTFHQTVFEPEVAARINLNNKPRLVPIRFRVFLTNIGSGDNPNYSYFTVA